MQYRNRTAGECIRDKCAFIGPPAETVALPTLAWAAISSMVSSEKPFFPNSFNVLRKIARRADSLRGRPGGRFLFLIPGFTSAFNRALIIDTLTYKIAN
jgi:hypothetical protein